MKTQANVLIRTPEFVPVSGVIIAALLALAGQPVRAPAATVTLRQGLDSYSGAKDAWLDESSKRDNNGGDTKLRIQYNSGLSDSTLIRFELPSLSFQTVSAATLSLYLYDTYSMVESNALEIKPYRIVPSRSWDENIYAGQSGFGVSWRYRDAAESYTWTSEYGAWYDKADDGNGTRWIKPVGGAVPGAIAPTNWVDWTVQPTVAQWYIGQENNGFGLFMNNLVGSGYIAAGLFYSRDNSDTAHRPTLVITYQGAAIQWAGYASAVWDTSAVNWNVGGYKGAYGDGDLVTFPEGASNPNVSVAGGGVSPGSMTVNNSSTVYNFSGGGIGGGGGLTKQGAGQATLTAANGYGGLTVVQGGKLIIAVNNALGTTGSGTVVSNGAALGFQSVTYSSTEPMTISGTGVLGSGALYAATGANSFAGPVTLAASSTVGVGSGLNLALNGVISGGYDVTKNGTGTLTFGGASANIYGGSTYVNDGTLALTKSVGTAVPGDLNIGDGTHNSTVRLDADGQLCPACDVTVRESSVLHLNNFNATIGGLSLAGGSASSGIGTLTLSGNVASAGNTTATIGGHLNLGGAERELRVADGTAEDDLVISANVTNGAILKTGAGRIVLSGDNTFDGSMVVSNGTTVAASATALGSTAGDTIVSNAARLELRGNVGIGAENLTLNGSGSGLGALRSVTGDNSWAGPITLGSLATIQSDFGATLTSSGVVDCAGNNLDLNTGGDVTLTGPISGVGTTVTKTGPGILTFGGALANAHTGATVVNQGTLLLAKLGATSIPGGLMIGDGLSSATVLCLAATQIAPMCVATVRENSVLNLNGFDAALSGLTLSGGSVKSGTGALRMTGAVASGGPQDASIAGHLVLDGTQDLNVAGAGRLSLPAGVSGNGFNKRGPGQLVFLNTNAFSAESVIAEGFAVVKNNPSHGFGLGPGLTRVENSAVLGGTGSISGPILVQANAVLSPGASVGTLSVSNTVSLADEAILRLETDGPAPAIDLLDLCGGGDLLLAPQARLEFNGGLVGSAPYILVKRASAVHGTFQDLPESAEVPGQPGWFMHYGTHRVYFSRAQQPIVYFRAFSTNGVCLLMWRTGEEIETKTFDLFQWSGSEWLKVNVDRIAAQNPNGAVYLLVNPLAHWNNPCRFQLVANTPDGEEVYQYERDVTEFAFSTPPRPVAGGVELRWFSRVDETYDLLSTPDLNQPLQLLSNGIPATPPECVITNQTTNTQGYYRLRLVP